MEDLNQDVIGKIYEMLDTKDRANLGILSKNHYGIYGDYQRSLYTILKNKFLKSNFSNLKTFYVTLKVNQLNNEKNDNRIFYENDYIIKGNDLSDLMKDLIGEGHFLFDYNVLYPMRNFLRKRLNKLIEEPVAKSDEFIYKIPQQMDLTHTYNVQFTIFPVKILPVSIPKLPYL